MLANLQKETKESSEKAIEKVSELGFESIWFVPNLGSVVFFFCIYPILLMSYLPIKSLSKKRPSCHNKRRKLRGMLFWQLPIQSIQDNYIVVVICALINLLYGSWGNGEAILNSSLAAVTLVFLAVYPVGI